MRTVIMKPFKRSLFFSAFILFTLISGLSYSSQYKKIHEGESGYTDGCDAHNYDHHYVLSPGADISEVFTSIALELLEQQSSGFNPGSGSASGSALSPNFNYEAEDIRIRATESIRHYPADPPVINNRVLLVLPGYQQPYQMSDRIFISQLSLGLCSPSANQGKARVEIEGPMPPIPWGIAYFNVYDGASLTIKNVDIRAYFNFGDIGLFKAFDRSQLQISDSDIFHYNGIRGDYWHATFVLTIPAARRFLWYHRSLFRKDRLPLRSPRLSIDNSNIFTAGAEYATAFGTWPTLYLKKHDYSNELNLSVRDSKIMAAAGDTIELFLEPNGQNVNLIRNQIIACPYEALQKSDFFRDNFFNWFKNNQCTDDPSHSVFVPGASYGNWNIEANVFENRWTPIFRASARGVDLDMTGTRNKGNLLTDSRSRWCYHKSTLCQVGWSYSEDGTTTESTVTTEATTDHHSSARRLLPVAVLPVLAAAVSRLNF